MNELTPDEQGMLVDAIHDSVTVIHKGQRMNKRITELMLEAGKTIPGDKHIDADFCEKFAELIIRECIAICQDIDGEDNIDAKSGRQDCAVEIQEYFGVEQ